MGGCFHRSHAMRRRGSGVGLAESGMTSLRTIMVRTQQHLQGIVCPTYIFDTMYVPPVALAPLTPTPHPVLPPAPPHCCCRCRQTSYCRCRPQAQRWYRRRPPAPPAHRQCGAALPGPAPGASPAVAAAPAECRLPLVPPAPPQTPPPVPVSAPPAAPAPPPPPVAATAAAAAGSERRSV